MSTTAKRLMRGAGGAGAAEKYIENLFSTYLYTGTGTGYAGSEQNIINGIDVSGKGALIWIKARGLTNAYNSYWNRHQLYDTNRGITFALNSNTSDAHGDTTDSMSTRADGFRLASGGSYYQQNFSGVNYVSWTFRKQPKFFDIVTWTADGTSNRQIPHNLGSAPGFITCKRTDSTGNWRVYHSSQSGKYANLEDTGAFQTDSVGMWASVTSTYFISNYLNGFTGATYVTYLFANDAGGFGLTGTDNVISCGSFSGSVEVNLGYEAQWVLIKDAGGTGDWYILDTMRGMSNTQGAYVRPNAAAAEASSEPAFIIPTATGFRNVGGGNYIYIAIRKGPMKVPTVGTSVFGIAYEGSTTPAVQSSFPIDFGIWTRKDLTSDRKISSRLQGVKKMYANLTTAEESDDANLKWNYQNGYKVSVGASGDVDINWMFRRAPGFFDVVCYTGNGTSNTINHNLAVEPELIIFKSRSATENWVVLSDFGPIYFRRAYLDLTNTGPQFGYGDAIINSKPSATSISLLSGTGTNSNAATYVAYLFATCPGVSKVGTYTGNGGSSQDIDCGFTSGARFVLVKAVSGTGDWWVWDTTRGITSGNDSSMRLSTTDAEVTSLNFINPLASGFTVVGSDSSRNGDGIKYIFLAIA